MLQAYFRSGWTFLIPYLGCYLLYAWLRWPVNTGSRFGVPALLQVFWVLHAVHFVLATVALQRCGVKQPSGGRSFFELLWPMIPWGLLGLFLYLPGAYLEFPADPWAHLARITEWGDAHEVMNHSVWEKSSYFLAYSLVGWLPKTSLMTGLDIYQTAVTLLLLWNYYRLGRLTGLEAPGAFVFATAQSVLFGNNIFTFPRYYGLSSTLLAQLATVALLRVALEAAAREPGSHASTRWRSLLAAALLVCLIYFNHIQGIPLAALGLLAVGLWYLNAHYPSARYWLLVAMLAGAGAAVAWWPRHPALLENYRGAGWLNFFYGFNLLSPSSPAFEMAAQVLGLFGALNLVAGLVLLTRNHIVGWLTVTPLLILLHPLAGLPLANYFAGRNMADIVVFSRLFFAIPCGLAFLVLAQTMWFHCTGAAVPQTRQSGADLVPYKNSVPVGYGLVVGLVFLSVSVPAGGPWYSRLWQAVVVVPNDLALSAFREDVVQSAHDSPSLIVGSAGLSVVFNAYWPRTTLYEPLVSHRLYHRLSQRSPASDLQIMDQVLTALPNWSPTVLLGRTTDFFSPHSTAAFLSQHWLPQETALAVAGRAELVHRVHSLSAPPPNWDFTTASFLAAPAAKNYFTALRPVTITSTPSASKPLPNKLYLAELPQLPAMATGRVGIRANLTASGRPWANLLMITAADGTRGVYLYVRCETGALYCQFFGHDLGPFPAAFSPDYKAKIIEFQWSNHSQNLWINGQLVSRTTYEVPVLAAASRIQLGAIGPTDPDFWPGKLTPESLVFGYISPAPSLHE